MYVINVLICAIFNNNGEKENYMEKRFDFAVCKQKADLPNACTGVVRMVSHKK